MDDRTDVMDVMVRRICGVLMDSLVSVAVIVNEMICNHWRMFQHVGNGSSLADCGRVYGIGCVLWRRGGGRKGELKMLYLY